SQSSCDHTFPNNAADGRLHEYGLISELLHLHVACYGFENVGHGGLDPCRHRERGGAAILENAEQRAPDTILPNNVFLRKIAVTHLRDIVDVNNGSGDPLYPHVAQVID